MTIAETYAFLSRITAYPEKKEALHAGSEAASRFFQEQCIPCPLAPFTEFVAASTLATLQEDYVATFDFSPAVALYLGHHLYGDNANAAVALAVERQDHETVRLVEELCKLLVGKGVIGSAEWTDTLDHPAQIPREFP